MLKTTCIARPFNNEEEAYRAVIEKRIKPGDAVFIRYEGPKGSGMLEMFYTTEAIVSDLELAGSVCLITDGRFSGASRGPIALVEEGDLIVIDIPQRTLNIVGIKGERKSQSEINEILIKRKAKLVPYKGAEKKGILKIYTKLAVSPMKGGYME